MTEGAGGSIHCERAVDAGTPVQMARAVVRYRLTSRAILAPLLFVAAVLVATRVGVVGVVVGVVLTVVAVVAAALLGVPRLARQLEARGFRPGTVVTADWGEQSFTVTTAAGSGVHEYTAIRAIRDFGGATTIRLEPARFLIVLPRELVPGEIRRRFQRPASGGFPQRGEH